MIGARFYTQLDASQMRNDIIEEDLAKVIYFFYFFFPQLVGWIGGGGDHFPIHTFGVAEEILPIESLYSESRDTHHRNTLTSAVCYSWQHWLSWNCPTGWLYRSSSVGQHLYSLPIGIEVCHNCKCCRTRGWQWLVCIPAPFLCLGTASMLVEYTLTKLNASPICLINPYFFSSGGSKWALIQALGEVGNNKWETRVSHCAHLKSVLRVSFFSELSIKILRMYIFSVNYKELNIVYILMCWL